MTNWKINKIEFNRVKLATWEIFGITGLDSNNGIRKLAYRSWWIKIGGSNVVIWKISNIKRYQFKLGALGVFGIAEIKSYNYKYYNWKWANPRWPIQDGRSKMANRILINNKLKPFLNFVIVIKISDPENLLSSQFYQIRNIVEFPIRHLGFTILITKFG